jgi:hypothetical protein
MKTSEGIGGGPTYHLKGKKVEEEERSGSEMIEKMANENLVRLDTRIH